MSCLVLTAKDYAEQLCVFLSISNIIHSVFVCAVVHCAMHDDDHLVNRQILNTCNCNVLHVYLYYYNVFVLLHIL